LLIDTSKDGPQIAAWRVVYMGMVAPLRQLIVGLAEA